MFSRVFSMQSAHYINQFGMKILILVGLKNQKKNKTKKQPPPQKKTTTKQKTLKKKHTHTNKTPTTNVQPGLDAN